MMALNLARSANEVGVFCALPDKSDVGETTHDVAVSYFPGPSDSGGESSMGGKYAPTCYAENEP